jgi:hypothetical protein
MKKNKFLSLLGLMLMAAALTTFTACSGSDDDNNQSGTTSRDHGVGSSDHFANF